MKDNKFNFCPNCGKTNIQTKNNGYKWYCPDCNFDLYCNVAAAVGVIIQREDGKVLFERRAKEPRKGALALPGGFVSIDESAEIGAVREVKEELGIDIDNIQYIASFPNTYLYRDIVYKTCDLFFKATANTDNFKTQEREVSSIEWVKVESIEDIDSIDLAFPSAKFALTKWIQSKRS